MTRLDPRPVLRRSAGIAVAMAVMNLGTYGATIVAARLLGPRSYGGFAAVMGLLLVVGVVQLGIQATGARRVAATPGDVGEIERAIVTVTYRTATVLGLALLALSPVLNRALHLESIWTALLVGLCAWPMTVMGGQAGILQGERRWYPLAVLYMSSGVSRLAVASILLLLKPTETMAMVGVTVSFVLPAIVGWAALRRSAVHRSTETSGDHDVRTVFGETARNSHALLAFFALSNADIILARALLPPHQAGLYAGGLILVKAVLFLPQFVVIVAFPSMSSDTERQGALVKSVLLVLGLGALATIAASVLSGLALIFVGGQEYVGVQHRLWLFAILGTLLSMLQLLVYSVVARQSQRSVYLIWGALALLVLAATRADGATSLVTLVSGVDAALFLVLLAVSLWRIRTTGLVEEPEPAVRAG
ncbi:polysaccharide biosynthesis protein [Nocardioides mangrovicus]|uniref:Polysaccharide biosynthesis protein n=1 Tax=Nocardioides mangrovicus TaxID=2478913 RepID=A0A3L8P3E4_9ACTN|nr:oligosaccharide flippase family protein [Nocardioides mangrovicus]RLV49522.1 polysaccharide biosynthesis protein [Nocardioides mangrovicus]